MMLELLLLLNLNLILILDLMGPHFQAFLIQVKKGCRKLLISNVYAKNGLKIYLHDSFSWFLNTSKHEVFWKMVTENY